MPVLHFCDWSNLVHQCFVATLLCQTKLIIMQEFRKGSHIFGPTIPFSHLYCLFYFCDWSNLMHCNVLLPLCCVGLVLLECIPYSITFALIWHYSNKFRSTPQSNVLPHLKVLPIQDPKIWPNYWRKVGVKVALSTIWFSFRDILKLNGLLRYTQGPTPHYLHY